MCAQSVQLVQTKEQVRLVQPGDAQVNSATRYPIGEAIIRSDSRALRVRDEEDSRRAGDDGVESQVHILGIELGETLVEKQDVGVLQ